MFKINIISNNKNWKLYLNKPDIYIQKKIKNLNKKIKEHKRKNIFFTLLLSGNNEIKKLNKRFRKKNKVTDILSFPFYEKKDLNERLKKEKEIYLGDIILNLNKIKYKSDKKKFKLEVNKLWIHGLVHLFGYNHKTNKDYFDMQKLEKKFLSFID